MSKTIWWNTVWEFCLFVLVLWCTKSFMLFGFRVVFSPFVEWNLQHLVWTAMVQRISWCLVFAASLDLLAMLNLSFMGKENSIIGGLSSWWNLFSVVFSLFLVVWSQSFSWLSSMLRSSSSSTVLFYHLSRVAMVIAFLPFETFCHWHIFWRAPRRVCVEFVLG